MDGLGLFGFDVRLHLGESINSALLLELGVTLGLSQSSLLVDLGSGNVAQEKSNSK